MAMIEQAQSAIVNGTPPDKARTGRSPSASFSELAASTSVIADNFIKGEQKWERS
jgi:hypothetical protein